MILFKKNRGIVVKKLKGDLFIYSANRLKDGKVVFWSKKHGWVEKSKGSTLIKKSEIENYKEIVSKDELNCLIISPYLVEVDQNGQIVKLREKIRDIGK